MTKTVTSATFRFNLRATYGKTNSDLVKEHEVSQPLWILMKSKRTDDGVGAVSSLDNVTEGKKIEYERH